MSETPEYTAQDVLRSAYFEFTEAGLRLPPIPRTLVGQLDQFGPWHYGTRDVLPADRAALVEEAADPSVADYVSFGHVGHGAGSWVIAARLVVGPLAVFIRHPWGGARSDRATDSVAVHRSFHQLEELIVRARQARADGTLSAGQRVVVVEDSRQTSGWQVLGADGQAWTTSRDPIAAAVASLSGDGSAPE